MEGTLILDVVIRKRVSVHEVLAGKGQALLVRWRAVLVKQIVLVMNYVIS